MEDVFIARVYELEEARGDVVPGLGVLCELFPQEGLRFALVVGIGRVDVVHPCGIRGVDELACDVPIQADDALAVFGGHALGAKPEARDLVSAECAVLHFFLSPYLLSKKLHELVDRARVSGQVVYGQTFC